MTWHNASGGSMRNLLVMGIPYQHAPEVSIASTPHAGRLEGASDRPEFEGRTGTRMAQDGHSAGQDARLYGRQDARRHGGRRERSLQAA
jgi:hypothetical protein